ncbi:DUF4386 domain-containing protein [Terricaulis silvestris]|uniref:DUF4386 domain-containing protein n=1 Tax=Terricaulis silvestris TaxID=2686094 RepID=A0A6I6MJ50_9CAUL|nr:DUF4386 domain-containing protein [Terricaulis silvestris]QGZ95160.1 hypothetical protein DSM104635_02004 [Terricaulis silvestris]
MTLSYATQARIAGLSYLVVALTGAFNLLIVPAEIIGADAATTFANAQAQAQLFRLGITAGIVCQIFFVITPVLLYVLLAPLGRIAALLMLGFALVSVPISFANISEHMAILQLATGEGAANTIAAIAQHTDAYNRGASLVGIFWGLWLAPLGWLIAKSGTIPRILGIFLILGCIGYVTHFFLSFFAPGYEATPIADYIHTPSAIGELGTCLWFLILGAKDKRPT